MTNYLEEQKKEIKTIKGRKVTIELSDADVERISKKAGCAGMTVSELLRNFIGDLVGGTYSNGSDERMYAQEWFDRCGFEVEMQMCGENTFLLYLLNNNALDEVIRLHSYIQSAQVEILHLKAHPEDAESDEVSGLAEDINWWQEQIDDEFAQCKQNHKNQKFGTLEEEMEKVLEWNTAYKKMLEE